MDEYLLAILHRAFITSKLTPKTIEECLTLIVNIATIVSLLVIVLSVVQKLSFLFKARNSRK